MNTGTVSYVRSWSSWSMAASFRGPYSPTHSTRQLSSRSRSRRPSDGSMVATKNLGKNGWRSQAAKSRTSRWLTPQRVRRRMRRASARLGSDGRRPRGWGGAPRVTSGDGTRPIIKLRHSILNGPVAQMSAVAYGYTSDDSVSGARCDAPVLRGHCNAAARGLPRIAAGRHVERTEPAAISTATKVTRSLTS
jgi:hypothetical protein